VRKESGNMQAAKLPFPRLHITPLCQLASSPLSAYNFLMDDPILQIAYTKPSKMWELGSHYGRGTLLKQTNC